MSDKNEPEVAPAAAAGEGAKPVAKKSPPAWLPAVAIVGALAAGGALGMFVVGPGVAGMRAGTAATADGAGDEDESNDGGGHGAKEKSAAERPQYKLDNLIVNPSGARGTRFLMTSIVLDLPDAKLETKLRDNDAPLRDAIIGALERQTLEALSQPAARDSVRTAIGHAIAPLLGGRKGVRVYLTQFVIQ